jgi:hypothetical protein
VFRVDNDAYLRVDEYVRSMVPKLPQKRLYLGNFLASNKAGPLWHNYWVCGPRRVSAELSFPVRLSWPLAGPGNRERNSWLAACL